MHMYMFSIMLRELSLRVAARRVCAQSSRRLQRKGDQMCRTTFNMGCSMRSCSSNPKSVKRAWTAVDVLMQTRAKKGRKNRFLCDSMNAGFPRANPRSARGNESVDKADNRVRFKVSQGAHSLCRKHGCCHKNESIDEELRVIR